MERCLWVCGNIGLKGIQPPGLLPGSNPAFPWSVGMCDGQILLHAAILPFEVPLEDDL